MEKIQVLNFDEELSIFQESEDPLHSSLHLEDLPKLTSATDERTDSESESDHDGSDKRVVMTQERHKASMPTSKLHASENSNVNHTHEDQDRARERAIRALQESFEKIQYHKGANGDKIGNGGSHDYGHTEMNMLELQLPAPPSFDEDDVRIASEALRVAKMGTSINCKKAKVTVKPASVSQSEEEKVTRLNRISSRRLIRKSTTNKAQSFQPMKMPLKEYYRDLDYLFQKQKQRQRQRQSKNHKMNDDRQHDEDDSCSYTIPHINTIKSSHSTESTATNSSSKVMKCTTGLKTTQKSTTHIGKNESDVISQTSTATATTVSSRISHALQPKWLRRRNDRNREKKEALVKARKDHLHRNRGNAHNTESNAGTPTISLSRDDDSIVTDALHGIGDGEDDDHSIIENMESLNLFSNGDLLPEHGLLKSEHESMEDASFFTSRSTLTRQSTASSSTAASVASKSVKSTPVVKSKPSKSNKCEQSKIQSLVSTKPSPIRRHRRSKSDSPMVTKLNPLKIQQSRKSNIQLKSTKPAPIKHHRRSKSDSPLVVGEPSTLSSSHSHRSRSELRLGAGAKCSVFVSPASSKSLTSRNQGLKSKIKTQTEDIDNVQYPIVHFEHGRSFRREDTDIDRFSVASSVGSESVSSTGPSPKTCRIQVSRKASSGSKTAAITKNDQNNKKTKPSTSASKPKSLHRRSRSDQGTFPLNHLKVDPLLSPQKDTKRTRSLQSAASTIHPSELTHLKHLDVPGLQTPNGTQYASHLLQTPSSMASTPGARSLLNDFLQGSPHSTSSSRNRCDSASIASTSSAISNASSYTALSNLSFASSDPFAKPSKMLKKSNLALSDDGDGDIWVEKIFQSRRTGKQRIFFVSVATGMRKRGEPPTGASKVIYREDLEELKRTEKAGLGNKAFGCAEYERVPGRASC